LKQYDPTTIKFPAYLDDLEALRNHLGQEELLLVGHSWRTLLALSYGGTHPSRTRAIVALAQGPTTAEHAEAAVRGGCIVVAGRGWLRFNARTHESKALLARHGDDCCRWV
jgi:pimeloyl-ACP methyl ester carboxylesterase